MVESSSSGLLSRRRSASRNSDSARNDTGLEHLMIAWHQTELGHPTEGWATQPCRFRAFAFRRWHAASRLITSYDIVFLYDIVTPYDVVFLYDIVVPCDIVSSVIPSDGGAYATAREEPRECVWRKCRCKVFPRSTQTLSF